MDLATATWTTEHRFFDNGASGKVYCIGSLRLEVMKTSYLEDGAEDWSFRYLGAFFTERHDGYKTMKEAKDAAVSYVTQPWSAREEKQDCICDCCKERGYCFGCTSGYCP